MIRPGEEWSRPASGPPAVDVTGDDRALARCVETAAPGALLRFTPGPDSDLARALGLAGAPAGDLEVALDAIDLGAGALAVNMAIVGTPPARVRWRSRSLAVRVALDGAAWFSGRATTIVVAVGQFHHGTDLVPRGHPGDGRAEIQVYAVRPRERRRLRSRARRGDHVPHPDIAQRTARRIEISADAPLPWEADGVARDPTRGLHLEVLPGRYRLLL